MARKLCIQYSGAVYYVMNRGDRREAIFEDDEDRQRLLETLGEAYQKTRGRFTRIAQKTNNATMPRCEGARRGNFSPAQRGVHAGAKKQILITFLPMEMILIR